MVDVAVAAVRPPRGRSTAALLSVVLLAFGAGALVAAAGLAWQHVRLSTAVVADARQRVDGEVGRTASALDAMLAAAARPADAAARAARDLAPGDPRVRERLQAILPKRGPVLGVGAAYDPAAFAGPRRLFAPYVSARDAVQVEARYDYTKFEHSWFGDTLLDGATWSAPVADPGGDGAVAIYSVPMFRPGADPARDAPAGVAFATIPLEAVAKALAAMQLGSDGYAFVFGPDGRYVAHPRRDLVARGATVFETAWTAGDTGLNSAAIHGLKHESGLAESIDPETGQAAWIAYRPIPAAGWTLMVIYFRDAFGLSPDRQRRDYFRIAGATVIGVGLIGLALFVLGLDAPAERIWLLAATVSLLVGAGTALLWWVGALYPAVGSDVGTRVLDAATAEQYLQTYEREAGNGRFTRVPTGVFLKSIEFQSSTNVSVTGFVWQRLPAPAAAQPAFVLADADKPEIREVSRHREGTDEVVLWSFAANLRENFSYEKYPFDQQEVWVRLRPADITGRSAFVPALASYSSANPAARPGVAADLVLPGWEVRSSFFDYRAARYNANFGFERFDTTTAPPELYFNVVVRRRFIGPFVSNVVPLTVAWVMIFSLLLIASKTGPLSRLAGFTAKDIVAGSAAVFFVISFQHIALRNALASPRLIYFEYFYFTTYLALLSVVSNAILFASGHGSHLLEFRDNLLPKVAFWPTLMTCFFLVTLMVFY